MRISDFQICAPSSLALDDGRVINHALFSAYEPVRLWLKENGIHAPFRKLVVSLLDERSSARWHGKVSNVFGVCEVNQAIDVVDLRKSVETNAWVFDVALRGLGCVKAAISWESPELEAFIGLLLQENFPHTHLFENLARTDEKTGVRCVPWLSTRPGETKIGLRIGNRDVDILAKPEPILLEDEFPMKKSELRNGRFLLLDKHSKTLAAVEVASALLPS